jgi:DNA-binding transcriptional MerR regulator
MRSSSGRQSSVLIREAPETRVRGADVLPDHHGGTCVSLNSAPRSIPFHRNGRVGDRPGLHLQPGAPPFARRLYADLYPTLKDAPLQRPLPSDDRAPGAKRPSGAAVDWRGHWGAQGRQGMIEAFSQDLVSRITGLSRRQLEYWDEIGVVRPSVAPREERGDPRLYSFADLMRLSVAARMRDRDFLPGQIRDLVSQLEDEGFADPLLTVRFVGDPQGTGERGGRVFIIRSDGQAPESARKPGQQAAPYENLDLQDLRTGLVSRIDELTQRRPGKVVRLRSVQGSRPVLDGTRIPVAKVAKLSAGGWSNARIRQAFPRLTDADISAALKVGQRRRSA